MDFKKFKLVVPVTPLFLENYQTLLPLVEAIEFKGTAIDFDTSQIYPQKHLLFHSHINISYSEIESVFHQNKILEFMGKKEIKDFSFHIGLSDPSYKTIPIIHKSLPGIPVSEKEFFSTAEKNIGYLQDNVAGVIAAENLDYIEGGAYEFVCTPEFISKFILEFDLAFLLDIGHLIVTAQLLGYNLWDYIDLLPLEKIYEIHIHSPFEVDGILRDLHHLPTEKEYNILEYVLKRAKPEYINLECYSDINGIKRELNFLLFDKFIKN